MLVFNQLNEDYDDIHRLVWENIPLPLTAVLFCTVGSPLIIYTNSVSRGSSAPLTWEPASDKMLTARFQVQVKKHKICAVLWANGDSCTRFRSLC